MTDDGFIHTIVLVHVPPSFREAKSLAAVRRKLRGNESSIMRLVAEAVWKAMNEPELQTADQLIASIRKAAGEAGA